jgi:SAM-dependent methyltransferase
VHEICGKSVLEVGSQAIGGSIRPYIESLGTTQYIGVDLEAGPGVDEICDAAKLIDHFGYGQFDVVVSTEMMEHARDWRGAINNMRTVLRSEGIIVITTRSLGWPYHAYPDDYWRFELDDIRRIFSDFSILSLEPDNHGPGVFLKAQKRRDGGNVDLDAINLYSIVKIGGVIPSLTAILSGLSANIK